MDKDYVITVRLRVDQINLLLAKLGSCPYNEVVELITVLKSQGDAALEMARQRQEPSPLRSERDEGNGLEVTER